MPTPRYMLLQVRNMGDPMLHQEVRCFARRLECDTSDIDVFDLLGSFPTTARLKSIDIVLLGGSGEYSAAGHNDWLEGVLAGLAELCEQGKPTFASCWGFQAIARALGGTCVYDPPHAELGTIRLTLTDEGKRDPLFGQLPTSFGGQAGHEDHVIELPPEAVRLASSATVPNQAFRVNQKPIYCTQFHPELDRRSLIQRIEAYPFYVERIAGMPLAEFEAHCHETPESNSLLKRFADLMLG